MISNIFRRFTAGGCAFQTQRYAGLFLAVTGILFAVGGLPAAVPHPVFINQEEIDAIKAKVQAGQQPWLGGYNAMVAAANGVKNTAYNSIPIVTDNGGFQGNTHVYKTDNPYVGADGVYRDGVLNPNADRTDYTDAIAVGKAVRNLGLAYRFTGDAAYAAKAVEYIRRFCLDSATYLAPQYTTDTSSHIELSITVPGIIYGASLIEDYAGWPAAEKTAFATWVSNFYASALTWWQSDNHGDWNLVLRTVSAAYLGDTTKLAALDTIIKQRIGGDAINGQGQMFQELTRTNSLSYSTYDLNTLTLMAEIGRHWGYDWYHYTANGRSLKLAYDYHAPFVTNPGTWPYQQITAYSKNDNTALYEMAYSQFQAPAYLAVLNRWVRPFEEIRVAGWVTLTHGNLFDLSIVPSPPSAPGGLGATASIFPTQVNLSWTDNSINETGFKIERKSGSGSFSEIAQTGPQVTNFSDRGLSPNTSYTYRMRAVNTAGNSAYSNEATVTTAVSSSTSPVAPAADAFVRGGSNAAMNFGADSVLTVKLDWDEVNRETFLRFDVRGMATASQVKLVLMPVSAGANVANLNLSYEFVASDSWGESAITWNNKPSSSSVLGAKTGYVVNQPVEIDVSAQAKVEAAGDGFLSIRIRSLTVDANAIVSFGSRENVGNEPYVRATYPSTTPTPTPTPAPAPSLVGVASIKTQGAALRDVPLAFSTGSGSPTADAANIECRSEGKVTVVLTFDKPVTSAEATIASGAATIDAPPSASGNKLVLLFSGAANAQNLRINLTNILAGDGGKLTGAAVLLPLLHGDIDGDGAVTAADVSLVRAASSNAGNFRADVNCDGAVTMADVNLVRAAAATGAALP